MLNLYPVDTYARCDDLWCITSYFNPAHYRTRRANYEIFADRLHRSGISLLTVECAFDADAFELPSVPDVLQVRSPSILWQKERLLNLALVHLPPHVKKVAWLDCDILFTNPEWAAQTSQLLEKYMVVQPFQLRVKLPRDNGKVNDQEPPLESFAYLWSKDVTLINDGYWQHGSTGFAWAARRNLLDKHGLYDTALDGIGDHLIAHAICGDWQGVCVRNAMQGPVTRLTNPSIRSSLPWRLGRRVTPAWLKRWLFEVPLIRRKNDALRRHFFRWAQPFYRDVRGQLGYTPGEILHLWHGAIKDRGYDRARLDLNTLDFDPTTDLRIGTSGCWECKRQARAAPMGGRVFPFSEGRWRMSPLPNFFVIGAGKSGTTALYHCLKQHPQIYMSPVKEPGFFAYAGETPRFGGPGDDRIVRDFVTNLRDYQKLFEAVTDQIAIGEASNVYLTISQTSSQRIQRYLPHAKLLAVLRHPADRAYSAHQARVSAGPEFLSFTQSLDAEEDRAQRNWAFVWRYKARGFYHALLQPYFDRFPREQIRIYLYEDWNTKPRQVLRDIFRFLRVDETFVPDITKRHNVTFLYRNRTFEAFLKNPHPLTTLLKPLLPKSVRRGMMSRSQSYNLTKPPPLDPKLRRQLIEEYRDDILKLQELIERDLSHWLDT